MVQYALSKRSQFAGFLENQKDIEADWDITFGDRKNEIVFIGQDMHEETIKSSLDSCLATDEELATGAWKDGYEDEWPVERAYAIE